MWRIFDKIRRTPLATEPLAILPAAPAGTRGAPALVPGGEGLQGAIRACPSGALGVGGLDLGRCVMCGACAEAAPGAVEQSGRYALAVRDRAALLAAAGPEAVAGEIHAILGRSLQIRHLDAGSCNACDWEMAHLLNPVYDLQRFGVDFVASPRHADMLLVTGGVTRHLEEAVHRTFAAAGEPKLVVAVGTCAVSGGLIGRTYAQRGGADAALPVDVYVPGCPPRPEAILQGILLAVGRAPHAAEVAM